jgi:hypothetical protein
MTSARLHSDDPANDLDRFLGDPLDDRSALSFARVVALDEEEGFPRDLCDILDDWRLNEEYIPAAQRGRLQFLGVLLNCARVVARRDLTTAIAHIGAAAVPGLERSTSATTGCKDGRGDSRIDYRPG